MTSSGYRPFTGDLTVTDAAALHPGARGHDLGLRVPHELLRRDHPPASAGNSGLSPRRKSVPITRLNPAATIETAT